MGIVATVLSNDGKDLKVDRGNGDNVTAQQFGPSGDDAPPLKNDYSVLGSAKGSGNASAVAYRDQNPENYKAQAGEKRIYSRDESGAVKAEIHLKNDGTIEGKNEKAAVILSPTGEVSINNGSGSFIMEPGGDVVINGVRITKAGGISSPGGIQSGGDISTTSGATMGADFTNAAGISLGGHANDASLHKP